ncbi:aromatic ring-hydroxylating dioxygenase subunit alpha [Marinobacterium sp. D7]|uniref:aromatic ring-hydroxylating dioxygenase subunit alpha n=1 Tax=Marinobacterium ramblicola TaxID=2849041 RepID=UPI001C2D940F|nr:aromatic ring-hydroxylating dioxygenase subunit alpha [Marinobacterium ramblicola]MBV1788679.1 aromatic ring-hydroxylating dioxygenase subunit alpha [Marinobacterium ramblicola]
MPFLKNIWYVAAWDNEVPNEGLFTRTLLNTPVLFFRDDSGKVQAIHDRCPHRFAPLSMGRHCGNAVQCAYHGLEFNGSGACSKNPHGDGKIPRAAKVEAYPVVEKYSLIWIWMGDKEAADEALIPDFSCMDPERFYVAKRYLHAKANYVLESDNILDLSHIQFLHPSTLGSDHVSQAVTSIEQNENTVWSFRQTVNEIMPDFLYQAMGIPHGTRVDRWIDVRWDTPANMLLLAGATPTGAPRSDGTETPLPHLFSPETDTTTHYWFAFPIPVEMGEQGAAIAEQQVSGLYVPFSTEDLPMLEAQQKMMGDNEFWDLKPILLASDAAAVRARRVLDKMIVEEGETIRS